MGNIGSTGANSRRRSGGRRSHHPPPPTQPPQPEIAGSRHVFTGAMPYPPQYQNPNAPAYYHQYPVHYPAPPQSLPLPFPPPHDHIQHRMNPCLPTMPAPTPYVEHQEAVTIRNEVNLKKETLRIEPDEDNPGKVRVAFTFDATVSGSITIMFFAKEGEHCTLTPTKEDVIPTVTVQFKEGLAQDFRQPSGTGIDLSTFEEVALSNEGEVDVYPLAVKAEAAVNNQTTTTTATEGKTAAEKAGSTNSQITHGVFEKEKGEYHVRVVKQILWVNGMRYELQEIYGIANSVESDFDPGKECVICLSEPRDTTVLPCRHMCMCSGCAKVLRFQTNRCPICRQPVERLLEIKVNNDAEE